MRANHLITVFLLTSNFMVAQQWQLAPETAGDPIAAITVYQSDPDTVFALGAGFQLGPGLFRNTDGGVHWDTINAQAPRSFGSDVGALKVDPYDSKILYASVFGYDIESNNIEISTDGGLTWKVLFYGRKSPAPVIEIDPRDNKTVYVGVGPGFIRRFKDRGQTWDKLAAEPPAVGAELTSLAIAPTNDSILYAGYTIGIYKSTDQGSTWQYLNLGFALHSQTLVAVDPRSANTVYAAIFPSPYSPSYLGGVYKSIDGGLSWKEIDNGLTDEDKQIMSMKINSKNPNQIFIGLYGYGTQGKLCFQSTNGGDQWTDFSNGLPDSGVVNCIAVDTANSKMYAGVGGYLRGLFVTEMITDVKVSTPTVPYSFYLLQNYPNPFNPSTIVKYDVPRYSHLKIVVYDLLGRKIETLVDKSEQAGHHSVRFDGSRLAGGVYFYQLTSGSFVEVKKMVLIR